MIDSNTVAAKLVQALIADGISLSDEGQTQATLASLLSPLVSAATTLAQIETDIDVPLDTELEIGVRLTQSQVDVMAAAYAERAAAGRPLPGTPPGPKNWPSHDLSDDDVTLGVLATLKTALANFADAEGETDA